MKQDKKESKTYADVTQSFQQLTQKTSILNGQQSQESFEELKTLLTSDQVLEHYDRARPKKLYVDDGSAGLAAKVAQLHQVEGLYLLYGDQSLTQADPKLQPK